MIRKRYVTDFIPMVLIAILIGVAACTPSGSSALPTSTPIPTPVIPIKPTYTVKLGDVVNAVQFAGRIASVTEESLFFKTDGRVRTLYAKPGDLVKKGQVLADLENLTRLERQQALDKLAIRKAEIRLEMVKLQFKLVEKNSWTLNQKTYDVPLKNYEVELAQIALDEALMNDQDLEASIANSRIVAPMDGLLLTSSVVAGSTVTAYKERMVVVDPGVLEIGVELDSVMQAKIELNLPAAITIPNRADLKATGKVRRLPLAAVTSSGPLNKVQDATTRISMEPAPSSLGLAIGDRVDVSVLIESKKNVLWLPPQAIRTFEGRKFVIVQEGQLQRRLDIKAGIQSEDRVEVVEGLSEGQIVLAP